jgi:thymidylate kinase
MITANTKSPAALATPDEPSFESTMQGSNVHQAVVAVVGCDGTGKSTLTFDLLAKLRARGPVERRYLGLVSGEMGDKIKRLPFIGIRFERYLAGKATRALDMGKKLPGTGTALVMYVFSLWRAAQLRRVMRLARRGVLVITDRYPQAEIPGFHYDGPGLTAHRTDNWLVRKLAAREQHLYEWMASQKPALVIRLDIDADTAHARKLDHSLAELRDKISVTSRLRFNGARVLDIDARAPYSQVLGAALQAIDMAIEAPRHRGGG